MEAVIHQAPEQFGHARTRWTLALLRQTIAWLAALDLGSIYRLLKRLGIRYKRGRLHVHSPDPDYSAKHAAILAVLEEVRSQQQNVHPLPASTLPAPVVLVYSDQAGFERQPTLAQAYALSGRDQPLARLCHAGQAQTRVVAALDAQSGVLVALRRRTITAATLVRFFGELVAHHPQAERIYVVLDNWPVHFHPRVLAALEVQETPFALCVPSSWDERLNLRDEAGTLVSERTLPDAAARLAARRRWHERQPQAGRLPIQFLPLPTYAPWLNPIEKVWRKCRQERGHLHPYSDRWPAYRDWLDAFFASFASFGTGSQELLRYCGLLPA